MKYYEFIDTYSAFVLNETLKTRDIIFTVGRVERELALLHYDFSIRIDGEKIKIEFHHFNLLPNLKLALSHIDSLLIDRHGWFPSSMKLVDISGSPNSFPYDEDILHEKQNRLADVEISYEPKFDVAVQVPDTLYHLSVREFQGRVEKMGLVPKSKSKLSRHLDRVYLCSTPEGCMRLLPKMNMYYFGKNVGKVKMDTRWVLYEIDMRGLGVKLYKDPNSDGFYTVDSIPPDRIRVVDREE